MSPPDLLRSYLILEGEMMRLDDAGEDLLAEYLRDALDLFYRRFTDNEIQFLRQRMRPGLWPSDVWFLHCANCGAGIGIDQCFDCGSSEHLCGTLTEEEKARALEFAPKMFPHAKFLPKAR